MESTNYTNLNQVEQDTQSCDDDVWAIKTFADYFRWFQMYDIEVYDRISNKCNTIHSALLLYLRDRDADKATSLLLDLWQTYPKIRPYIDETLILIYLYEQNYESAWRYYNNFHGSLMELLFFVNKIGEGIVDGLVIIKTLAKSDIRLTQFGKEHIQDIIPYITKRYRDHIDNHGGSLLQLFNYETALLNLDTIQLSYLISESKNKDYYPSIFDCDDSIRLAFKYWYERERIKSLYIDLFSMIVRESEDDYRIDNNLPKIGEGWVNETLLYNLIKKAFPTHKVIHQGSPEWLGRQKFDIYIPSANLAIEYQGEQHFKPIDLFGGEEGLRKAQENDEKKRVLCERNDCTLIYVLENYDINNVVSRIEQVLKVNHNQVALDKYIKYLNEKKQQKKQSTPTQKKYSDELKRKIVTQHYVEKKSMPQLAEEYDLSYYTVRDWIRASREEFLGADNIKMIAPQKKYSAKLKAMVVSQHINDKISMAKLSRKYNVAYCTVQEWVKISKISK